MYINNINMNKIYDQVFTLIDLDDTNKIKFIYANSNSGIKSTICKTLNLYNEAQIDITDIVSVVKISDTEEVYNAYIISDELKGSNHFVANTKVPVEVFVHYISSAFRNNTIVIYSSLTDTDITCIYKSIVYIINEIRPYKIIAYTSIKSKSIYVKYYYFIADLIMIRCLNTLNNNSLSLKNICSVLNKPVDKYILNEDKYNDIIQLYSSYTNYYRNNYDDIFDMNNMALIAGLI